MMGAPVGIPKTGVFGLLDLVGVDLIPKVAASMDRLLPAGDRLRANRREQPLIGADDRGGLDRPEGQGRLLPSEPGERRAGSRRPSTSAPAPIAPACKPRLDSVAAAKAGGLRALVTHPDRDRPLRLGGAERDPGLRGRAGAGDQRHHPGRR